MSLPNVSVRRPVTIIMFYIGVVLLGIISWQRLPQELFPPITYPQLTIVTTYKDAAPEEIEMLITKPIEETVGTVSGLKRISSISKEETSLVIAEFNWGIDMDFAALGVREKIDLVKSILPRGSEDPIVMKFNPFELPVMVLNVTGPYSSYDLLELAKKMIKSELEKIEGVASANLSGGAEREIVIQVDQGRLQATGTSIIGLADSLKKANLNYPAGTIKEEFYEYLIRTIGEFQVVNEIKRLPIGLDETLLEQQAREEQLPEEHGLQQDRRIGVGRLIYISDVATVKDTVKEKTSISRYNGKDTISISIQKKAGGNTVRVAESIRRAIKEIKADLPKDININIVYDQSIFVKEAIVGVTDAAWQGGLLVFIVIVLFLKNIISSLIVAVIIPISILVALSLMYFQGITINMISFGGLALGVGMLVDVSIVVIENIHRHMQMGKDPKEASVYGTVEVTGAITGSVLTTVAVFLPMVFVIGIAGQLFKELALTVTYSLMASLVVALTLMPTLSSKQKEKHIKKIEGTIQDEIAAGRSSLKAAGDLLEKVLKVFLNHKFLGISIMVIMFLFSMKLLLNLNREFMPKIDQGQFVIKVEMPPGTRLEVTDGVVKNIEEHLLSYNEVKDLTVNIGSSKEKESSQALETLASHQARIITNLKPRYLSYFRKIPPKAIADNFRTVPTDEIIRKLQQALQAEDMEGAQLEYLLQESIFASAFQQSAPLSIEIKGQDLNKLKELTEKVSERLYNIKGVYGIRNTMVPPSPETKVHIFKDRATHYNLSVSDIAITAQTAIKGFVATKFKEKGKEIDVRVVLRPQDRKDMAKVRRLLIHSPLEVEVPLGEVAYLSVGKGPTEIRRQNQQRVVLVSANLYKRSLSEVAQDVDKIIKELKVPTGYSVFLTGENLQMQESFNSLQFALLLSIVLIYMIMAAQFESLWQPFLIMFTIPLSLIGVALALYLTGTKLGVMAIFGVIVLGGVVVDNGIVLIDFVNILIREAKYSPYDAVITASQIRLRPILMTALSTIIGLTPLAMGMSEGAQLQAPMAIAVMGGLAVSTFLSLVFLPTAYLIGDNFFKFLGRFLGQKKTVEPTTLAKTEQEGVNVATEYKAALEEIQQSVSKEPKPEQPQIELPQPEEPKPEQPQQESIKPDESNLNSRQLALIEYLKEKGRITRFEYAKVFNTSIPTASRDLKELLERNIIIGKGPFAKGRYYELTETFKRDNQIK